MKTKVDIKDIYIRYSVLIALLGVALLSLSTLLFFDTPLKAFFLEEPDQALSILSGYYITGLAVSGAVCLAGGIGLFLKRKALVSQPGETQSGPSLEYRLDGVDLFLISFVILFLELALIRWVPSYTKLLSYFSNFILLACFLGMGAGCLLSRRKSNFLDYLPLTLLLLVVFTLSMHLMHLWGLAENKVWGRAGDTTMIMGNAVMVKPILSFVPLEFILAIIFTLSAASFIGPGQTMGRAMETMPPLRAYAINICGSLIGILVFTAISFFSIPAPVWFAVVFTVLIRFYVKPYSRHRLFNAALLISVLLFTTLFTMNAGKLQIFWSPYYKISFRDHWPFFQTLTVNEIGHQITYPLEERRLARHAVPFMVLEHATGAPPEDVLIVGSGTGNDIAIAAEVGAKSIDAVEIDPMIQMIGREINPLKPYQNRTVTSYVNDGRAFLKTTDKKYDLVSFSILDSLTLFSTYSSVHLESFLFTRESFEEVKRHLKPEGVFIFYTYCRQHWLSTRTYHMMENVFDEPVVLLTIPSDGKLDYRNDMTHKLMIFIAGNTKPIIDAFNNNNGLFNLLDEPLISNLKVNGFEFRPDDADNVIPIGITEVIPNPNFVMPTDDWPFYYMRYKKLSFHDYRGLAVILVISLIFIFKSLKRDILDFNLHFFFLGGAFMLLEVSSITRMALLYGTTWIVNSIVFFSILLMAFFANLYVLKVRTPKVWTVYPALFIALALNYFIPLGIFMGMSSAAKLICSNTLMFLPIIFSGVIFSSSFSVSKTPAAHFGSNLLGIIIGGLAVYIAVGTGYQNLLLVVILMYGLSLLSIGGARHAYS